MVCKSWALRPPGLLHVGYCCRWGLLLPYLLPGFQLLVLAKRQMGGKLKEKLGAGGRKLKKDRFVGTVILD